MKYFCCFTLLICLAAASRGLAQDATPPPAAPPSDEKGPITADTDWPLESVRLESGKEYFGLIQFERPGEMEFVEVVRPPGKPMFLIVRPIELRDVVQRNRLPKEERDLLRGRIDRFRNRVLIEAGRMQDVVLRTTERPEGSRGHLYEGVWFSLESSSDEELTRRCIVRIEQIFRGYRQILPPRFPRPSRLQVKLFGSMNEYRRFLDERGWEVENPALFEASENLIVAGSELSRFAVRLESVRRQNEETLKYYDTIGAEMAGRLVELADTLSKSGYSREEISRELIARRVAWQKQYDAALGEIQRARRANDAKLAEVTGPMFARLYHEAFHAYLENYVYPHDRFDVPAWLNEGSAQIFEHGQLEADTLRIDAPAAALLEPLQADLGEKQPLPLEQLLRTGYDDFLVDHDRDRLESNRYYLYAWGLAYYLLFHDDPLPAAALDRYVEPMEKDNDPVGRFERLVGMTLEEFEPRWRRAILEMKPYR